MTYGTSWAIGIDKYTGLYVLYEVQTRPLENGGYEMKHRPDCRFSDLGELLMFLENRSGQQVFLPLSFTAA